MGAGEPRQLPKPKIVVSDEDHDCDSSGEESGDMRDHSSGSPTSGEYDSRLDDPNYDFVGWCNLADSWESCCRNVAKLFSVTLFYSVSHYYKLGQFNGRIKLRKSHGRQSKLPFLQFGQGSKNQKKE
ncbi:hypothetical protein L596_023651 [Steinernema carpocapsae]|uniref:Uncharacterized protein n=1 Tax=Steinernema carpocapsae TaxID=34508 RepID=A0A4U5MF19_STECR|nr:hypothetical protein L596_023651 [Steinernema carpocapsae]